jgi:hypothetical protein
MLGGSEGLAPDGRVAPAPAEDKHGDGTALDLVTLLQQQVRSPAPGKESSGSNVIINACCLNELSDTMSA